MDNQALGIEILDRILKIKSKFSSDRDKSMDFERMATLDLLIKSYDQLTGQSRDYERERMTWTVSQRSN